MTPMPLTHDFVAIDIQSGYNHTAAVSTDDDLFIWGGLQLENPKAT